MKAKFVSASNKLNKYVMAIDGVVAVVAIALNRMTQHNKSTLNLNER